MTQAILVAALFVVGALSVDPTPKDEDAMEAMLDSDKLLPETDGEREKSYGTKFVVTTYASEDCTGQAKASKKIEGCAGSPEIQECPHGIWTQAFSCKKTEKKEDEVFSQKWSWGIYNEQFMMKYHTEDEPWKATETGKVVGAPGVTTCFSARNDVRHVFLMHQLNSVSCRAESRLGTEEDMQIAGNKEAMLTTKGSFTITPEKPVNLFDPQLKEPTLSPITPLDAFDPSAKKLPTPEGAPDGTPTH
jgi:hypothetical protein